MLHKTRGIVLKTTNYGESSVIVQVFTEQLGMRSYMVNGVKKPKAKIKLNILQPLHLLDMVVYQKGNANIQRISELRQSPVFLSLPYEIVKSSMAIFLNEVLYKCIRLHSPEHDLFQFVFSAIEWLDKTTKAPVNFHLYFLLKLSKFLGFSPDTSNADQALYFDLVEGVFTKYAPPHLFFIGGAQVAQLADLLKTGFDQLNSLQINNADRRYLLDKVLDYYALHVDGMGEIKSHLILEEVLA